MLLGLMINHQKLSHLGSRTLLSTVNALYSIVATNVCLIEFKSSDPLSMKVLLFLLFKLTEKLEKNWDALGLY